MFKKILKHVRKGTLLAILAEILDARRNERKIKRELDDILVLPEKRACSAAGIILKKYFFYYWSKKHGLPRKHIKDIADFIVSRRKWILLPEEEYESLIKQAKELSFVRFRSSEWKKLSFLAMANGLFRLSAVYRDKAIEYACHQTRYTSASLENLKEVFKAAVDQGKYEKAFIIYDHIDRFAGHNSSCEKLLLFINLIKGDRNKAWSLAKSYYSSLDQAFARYIEGKTVAVVGPAPSGEELGAEIDSYDTVIRFNFRGKDFTADRREFGGRVNISYYNNEVAKIMSELENEDLFEDLDYAVFKDIKYPFQHQWHKKKRARILFSPDDYLLIGSANINPMVLYDLLHYKVSKIKLFKVNFYLAVDTHYAGYKPVQLSRNKDYYTDLWYNFAVHNPLTQLNLTRNLWLSGQIEVDKACEAVLSLNNEEYISKMEDIYVNKPISFS